MTRPNPMIYGEFDTLVTITVLGRAFEVPLGIPLLRAFQFIEFELKGMESDWSLFCFNDTIGCCTMAYVTLSETQEGRACCVRTHKGMEVTRLPPGAVLL